MAERKKVDPLFEEIRPPLFARTIDPETREYKMGVGDTDQMQVDVPKNNGASDETTPTATKSRDTGKLPKRPTKKDAPKDTQEAAAQMLRKFFNRG